MWRCMRHTKCYKECKDSIRHEHNRACGRCCVKIFPCCTKCCIPYTRPSASELRKERGKVMAWAFWFLELAIFKGFDKNTISLTFLTFHHLCPVQMAGFFFTPSSTI